MKKVVLMSVLAIGAAALSPSLFAQHGAHGDKAAKTAQKSEVYRTKGVIEAVDVKAKKLTIAHDPIPAARWPAMTMGFELEDASLLSGLKAKDKVRFDFRMEGARSIIIDLEALK